MISEKYNLDDGLSKFVKSSLFKSMMLLDGTKISVVSDEKAESFDMPFDIDYETFFSNCLEEMVLDLDGKGINSTISFDKMLIENFVAKSDIYIRNLFTDERLKNEDNQKLLIENYFGRDDGLNREIRRLTLCNATYLEMRIKSLLFYQNDVHAKAMKICKTKKIDNKTDFWKELLWLIPEGTLSDDT